MGNKSYDSEGMEEEMMDSADMEGLNEMEPTMGGGDSEWKDEPKKCSKSFLMSNLEGRLVIVKVGDADRPASPKDIKDVERDVKKILKGVNCRILVTHHAIDFMLL